MDEAKPESIRREAMNEKEKKRKEREDARSAAHFESAAIAGLKAIAEAIEKLDAEAQSCRLYAEDVNEADRINLLDHADECTQRAAGMREAIAAYCKAYEAKTGRRPKAKEAEDYEAIDLFALELTTRRRRLGLTQSELAQMARITFQTLNRLEHARHAPSLKTKKRLREALEEYEKRKRSQGLL